MPVKKRVAGNGSVFHNNNNHGASSYNRRFLGMLAPQHESHRNVEIMWKNIL